MVIVDNIKSIITNLYEEEILHYGASLSFHTILSLIPILLIVLSLFTQLPSFSEYYEAIKNFIFSSMLPAKQDLISVYIEQFLQNTVKMGVFGFIFVIFVSTMFFIDYEFVVNKIFHNESRPFWQSVATYWTFLTLTPIGIAITIYITTIINNFLMTNQYTSGFSILTLVPFFLIWAMFYVTFAISANGSVKNRAITIASLIASAIWYLSKTIFVYYITYNKTYLSIYGSFSTIMFFFLWIYLSWLIYLFGLKLCYNIEQLNPKDKKDEPTQST
jgi:membrane protein